MYETFDSEKRECVVNWPETPWKKKPSRATFMLAAESFPIEMMHAAGTMSQLIMDRAAALLKMAVGCKGVMKASLMVQEDAEEEPTLRKGVFARVLFKWAKTGCRGKEPVVSFYSCVLVWLFVLRLFLFLCRQSRNRARPRR